MKSVLLGGLKVFLVNDGGNPLSAPGGRAKFYRAGTSTPETVYSDIDLTAGTALGPVVYTDELGYLPAIWLKTDRLYKVRVEQKVSDDPEQWALLWEVDNVGYIDPHETEEFGEAPIMVDSIAALKGVDHSEHGRVLVAGYYEPGDWGEPSTFVYDPESTSFPDDGCVVQPNDIQPGVSGRWLQIFSGDILDVRKFGAIPDITENSDVTAKVVNAVKYSQKNSTRTRPITVGFVAPGQYNFAGNFDFSRYSFIDLRTSTSLPIKWFINNDVVLYNTSDSVKTFTLSKDTVCLATGKLVGGNALLKVVGGGEIKVDPAWWGSMACSVKDCYIECHSVTTGDKEFDNCSIKSNGFLSGRVTLKNMDFNERWFASGYQWSNLVLNSVNYGVRDCISANSYIDVKNSQHDYNYGDLGEQTVSGKTLGSGCVAENAAFSNVTISGNVELHNVSGTVNVSGANLSLSAIDCWLTSSSSAVVSSLDFYGGAIICESTITVLAHAKFDGTSINSYLTLICPSPSFVNSRIVKDVTQYPNGNIFDFSFVKCIFEAKHILTAGSPDNYVNGKWVDNLGAVSDPIYISSESAANLVDGEYNHGYIYSGNSGTFLPMDVDVIKPLSISGPYPAAYINHTSSLPDDSLSFVDSDLVLSSVLRWYNGVILKIAPIVKRLFTIGCGGARVRIQVCISFYGTTGLEKSELSNAFSYNESVNCDYLMILPSDGNLNLTACNGFFKKFIQKSVEDDYELLQGARVFYNVKVVR